MGPKLCTCEQSSNLHSYLYVSQKFFGGVPGWGKKQQEQDQLEETVITQLLFPVQLPPNLTTVSSIS